MSLPENSTDRLPAETSQSREQTHRLYPSLPNADSYDFCLAGRRPHTAAELHPENLPEDTQSEGSSHGGDVRMKAQILVLEEQRRELLSINEKWAKEYRTMVQYYKEKIQVLKVLQQQDQFEECEEGGKTSPKKQKFKMVKDTQSGEGDVSEKEAKELRVQNGVLTRRGQHQHEEIRRLNKALEEALQSAQPLGTSGETLRDIWKHQAEVYREDFFKERQDREKLKGKSLELEKRFRRVYNELRVLKSQVTWTRQPQAELRCPCGDRAKCSNWEIRLVNRHQIQLQTVDNKQ